MNKVDVTCPRAVWSDPIRYQRWCWETYGRYVNTDQPIEIKVRFRWY